MKRLTPTSLIHREGRLRLIIAILMVSPVTAHAASSDELAFNTIFGEETVSQNLERVRTLTEHLEPAERYQFLRAWVLPSQTHSSIRLNGRFLDQRQHAQGLYCPALELIEIAGQLDSLTSLRERVLALSDSIDHEQQRAVNSLLFIIELRISGNNDSTQAASRQLLKLMLEEAIEREQRLWPEFLACWVGLRDPQSWELVSDLLTELHLQLIENKISATDPWREQVAAMHGLLRSLQNGGTAARFPHRPELNYWIPADLVSPRVRNDVYPLSSWEWEENSLRNLASGPECLLLYQYPLRGDFEISCELPSLAIADIQLVYGGEFLFPDETRRRIHVGNVSNLPLSAETMDPQLSNPRETTWCRLVVRDQVCSTYFNGRLVHRRKLPPSHDPWLGFRTDSSLRHPAVKNLRIDGTPTIPGVVQLVTEPTLPGWRSPESARGEILKCWKFAAHEQGIGLVSIPTDDNPASVYESLIQYYRPLAEGESFEYEFFYGTGYQPAHPVIDDMTAVIKPHGIILRRPANESLSAELIEFSGLLKLDDWNHCRLTLKQNQVQLILNEQLIHSFPLRDRQPPLMGFYREADARSVRIRNIVWRSGDSPGFDTLEFQFVNQIPGLHQVETTGWEVIEHDFSLNGFPSDYFSTPGPSVRSRIARLNDGLLHAVNSSEDWDKSDLQPYFSLRGDFEIVLEFGDLQISKEEHGGCGIMLRNDDGRLIQFTRRARAGNEHLVIVTLRSPLKNRQVMLSEAIIVSEATSGRFRIVRQADTYHFEFAEADSDVFRTVGEETIEDAGETADRFNIRMLAHHNTAVSVTWKRLQVASQAIDQSRFVASGEIVTDEQWEMIESRKETLREIVLDGAEISDDDLARLKDHTGLRILWLKGTPVTSRGIRHLEKLVQLESLHLTVTNVDDDVGDALKSFTNLSSIGISITRVGDKTAEALSQLPRLQKIGLSRTQVTDQSVESLSKMQSLQEVDLSRTNVSQEAIQWLKAALPDCRIKY